jgi:hypothetical protein
VSELIEPVQAPVTQVPDAASALRQRPLLRPAPRALLPAAASRGCGQGSVIFRPCRSRAAPVCRAVRWIDMMAT